MELHKESAVGLAKKIAGKEVTAVEVTRHFLNRAYEQSLNAFLHVDAEGALAQAAGVDGAIARGEQVGRLAGVPIAVKDNICIRGVPTTCASKILAGYVPPYDATVIERLRADGAVLFARTNMDEFAMGSSNENSAFGAVKNPWDVTRAPGGSSGGSAAAAAAGLCAGALGSDTGGSVRQPGAFCGITAVKPTYGRISRYGLIAFASSLDQIGPMTRTVADSARLLAVMAGRDERDATSSDAPVDDYEAACLRPLKGLRLGIMRSMLGEGTDPEVTRSVEAALDIYKKLGATIVDVTLPHLEHSVAAYYLIAPAEASSNLARFDGVRYGLRVPGVDLLDMYCKTRSEGFGPEVKRRIMLGTYALSAGYYDAFYLKAQKVRTLIKETYDRAFVSCDALLTPTAPTAAFKLGEKVDDPLAMYLADIFTLPPSLAGIPAINVPCGFTAAGLPIGMQLCGRIFEESTLFALGAAFERETMLHQRWPS